MPSKLQLKRKKKQDYYRDLKKQKVLQLSKQSDTLEGPGRYKSPLYESKNCLKKIAEKTTHRKTYYKNYYKFNKEKFRHANQTNYAKKRKRRTITNDPFPVKKCMKVNNTIIQESDSFVSKISNENPLELNEINADKMSIIDNSVELSAINTPIDDLKLQDKVSNTNLSYDINTEKYIEPLMKKLIDENKLLSENAHIEAENMIKWVVAARRTYVKKLRSKLHLIKSKIEVVLSKTNLCQESKHKYEV